MKEIKKYIIFAVLVLMVAVGVVARTWTVEDVPNVHVADRTRFLTNPDGIVSPEAQTAIDSTLSRLRKSTTAEVVAVIVDDIEGGDIDTYATELFNHWGLGKSDNNNGVLILAAKDLRKAVIRTGPGAEGVLPDIVCGRILRQQMFPAFARGDYDTGMADAVSAVAGRLGDEDAAAEIRSDEADADTRRDDKSPFDFYLIFCVILTAGIVLAMISKLISLRGKTPYEKYTALESWRAPLLVLTLVGLFMPIVVSLPLVIMLPRLRNKPRKCPNCGTPMVKIDEVHDNDYLTPSQDAEERLGSVDYDVWHCPKCGETDIFPFVNKAMPLVECKYCHARAAKLTGDTVVQQPTESREGVGQRTYTCLNCRQQNKVLYKIAKLPPVIIMPIGGGGGRGGGFGGGSIGGGFGGGFTGGGGASGGW